MGRKPFFTLYITTLSVVGFTASSFASTYKVKSGDVLSKIVARFIPGKVWGESGNLKKVIAANPQIKNPDIILPGLYINLDGPEHVASAHIPISETKAVVEEHSIEAPLTVNHSSEVKPASLNQSRSRVGFFSVTPEFLTTQITGTNLSNNSKTSLFSKSNFGLNLAYTQMWTENFQTQFFFGVNKLNIKAPATGGTLQNADQTLYSFGALGSFIISPKLSLAVGLELKQQLYLKGLSTTALSLDPTYVPSIMAQGSYDLYTSNPFTLGLTAGANLDLPTGDSSEYRTKMNPGFIGKIYVKHDVSPTMQAEVGLKGDYTVQNTSIANQSQNQFGIYLRIQAFFGDGAK